MAVSWWSEKVFQMVAAGRLRDRWNDLTAIKDVQCDALMPFGPSGLALNHISHKILFVNTSRPLTHRPLLLQLPL